MISCKVIDECHEYQIALVNADTNNIYEYNNNAHTIADEIKGEVVEVYQTPYYHIDKKDFEESEFIGYGILVYDEFGDSKII